MKFSEESAVNSYIVQSYKDGEATINGKTYRSSLIISSDILVDDWSLADISQLETEHLQTILDMTPEVILIGTGRTLIFPKPKAYASVINLGIGIEFMDSAAACRTYNILVSEGRSVVTGIIL
jgi:uncharacterized protein